MFLSFFTILFRLLFLPLLQLFFIGELFLLYLDVPFVASEGFTDNSCTVTTLS